ncbi:HD domain-containing protein, partial [candidate division NPL-UPA2 bacterium]|nr:HD domain-containing protein [candidate division NPL-UPA2 bacterium]
ALREGAYDYLTKPFPMEKLLSILKRGIREQKLARENARLNDELRHTYVGVMMSLAAAIDAKNHRTQHHSQQVTKYTLLISEELKLPQKEGQMIGRAASLHDIGKIGIPDPVLAKTATLTDDEWAQIKLHPVRGAEMLSPLEFLSEIVPLIRHHHERYEGSGYPDGLEGEDITLGARIISVADAFDAMISERPYRKALNKKEALREIEAGLGGQFDPQIGELFISAIEKNKQDEYFLKDDPMDDLLLTNF